MTATEYPLYNGTPPHQRNDTSRAAAESIRQAAEPIRERVFARIAKLYCKRGERAGSTFYLGPPPAWLVNPDAYGATSDEVERHFELPHQTVSARLRELVLLGRLIDSGARRKTRSGRYAKVLIPAPAQGRLL